jgi:hypothetical protein
VHCEIKYAYLIRMDSEDGSRKPGHPAALRFLFDLLAEKITAKMSCEIDMCQPRKSKRLLIFTNLDSTGRRRHEKT